MFFKVARHASKSPKQPAFRAEAFSVPKTSIHMYKREPLALINPLEGEGVELYHPQEMECFFRLSHSFSVFFFLSF